MNGLYQVSNLGNIKSLRYNKIMSPAVLKNGYVIIMLLKDKKKKTFYVHRLVAMNFIENNTNKQVNHINGNKHDNRVENLEWVTAKDNTIKAYEIGLRKRKSEYIPKQKLRDKIEELEKHRKDYEEEYSIDLDYMYDMNAMDREIQVLKELLKEGD